MVESRYYIKRLTSAEAETGNNNVHEIYIRLTNDFDYKSFFQNNGYVNDRNARQIDFTVTDITFTNDIRVYSLRFIYYENSNGEKRIPSLREIFCNRGIKAGDTVCLESRTEDNHTSFYISFNKNNSFPLSGECMYYSKITNSICQLNLYKSLPYEKKEEAFAYYIEHLEERKVGANQIKKYSHTYIPHVDKYVKKLKGFSTLFDICSISDHSKVEKIASKDPNPDPNYAGAYQSCFNKYRRFLEELLSSNCRIDLRNFGADIFELEENKTTLPLQLIYFGAPGTSKSTTIKRETEEKGKEVHRITFHPDTDYSNFVGCYKPTKPDGQDKITYEFVAQTFVKAYVSAWKQLSQQKEVFLVIEEINRGNCAQIFGDLFQLLDRKADGYSDYAIEPDSDLQAYLKKEFQGTDVPEPIKSGAKMQLPPNLFIWATMNTSDQSLFPIDSAFKRRWDWKYLPITDAGKKHQIRVKTSDGKTWDYDWWQFLESVNGRIETLTESEDKQLGYWFARPRTGKEIDMDTFVGKVVFYLWNDIFKDFGEDGNSPFMIKLDDNKDKKEKVTFRKFFDNQGDVKGDIVKRFLDGLGITGTEANIDEPATEEKPAETPSPAAEEVSQTVDAPVVDATPAAEEETPSAEPAEEIIAPHVEAPQVNNITPASSAPEPQKSDTLLF